MISFLHARPHATCQTGEAYVEAISRLESLARTIETAEQYGLEARELPNVLPRVSKAEQLAFAEQMEAAAREGLAAVTAAGRTDVGKGGKLAEQLRKGGIDLDKLLTL